LPHDAAYYEGASGCYGLCSYPNCAGGFVRDLVAAADAAGLDWGLYDNDGPDGVPNSGDDDGTVDAVIIVHSGTGAECGGNTHIWSHSFYLRGWGIPAYQTQTPRAGGGRILVDDYIIQPEQSCWSGMIEIGVFCHEYGHALGLPDLYDTGGEGEGIGRWGLMSSGSWGSDGSSPERPVQFCAWSKCYLGWLTPVVVRADGVQELPAVELSASVLQLWSGGSPGAEYFLVENRQKLLNDAGLPAAGLNIWHIDESIIADGWFANTVNAGAVYGVALEQADGLDQLRTGANRGDAGDPWPGSLGRTSWHGTSSPDSRSNDGTPTGVAVQEISPSASTMTARIAIGVPEADATAPLVSLLAPNGGESWAVGECRTISWQATDENGVVAVDLLVSYDGGLTFPQVLASGLANSGSWSWQLPLAPTVAARVRAVCRDAAHNEGSDDSDASFAIVDPFPPAVALLCPLGGELWQAGTAHMVSWAAGDNVGITGVDLRLSTDDGATFSHLIAEDLSPAGEFNWTLPQLSSQVCRLLVTVRDGSGHEATDASGAFTIANLTAVAAQLPASPLLAPCMPNPFNPRTVVRYTNPTAGPLRISVYDLRGRRVRELLAGDRPAGSGEVIWSGTDDAGRAVASGVYYVQAVTATGQRALIKATLAR
jgi:M6 family metalloprotease-like protein